MSRRAPAVPARGGGQALFVQYGACWHRWWRDTGFGASDRPGGLDAPLTFPRAGHSEA